VSAEPGARGARVPIPAGGFLRIAVLRLSSLGDVILTLPVVRALAGAYPEARIDYWVKEEYADVVRFDPAIAHVRTLERDARRIEDVVSMGAELEDIGLIVDLHGSARTRVLTFRQKGIVLRAGRDRLLRSRWVHARWTHPRPARHTLERYAAALGPLGLAAPGPPRVEVGPDAAQWAAEQFGPAAGDVARIAMCPGARHFTKRWPEEHWVALHDRLAAAGAALVYVSTVPERAALPRLAARVAADPRASWWCESVARAGAALSRCRVAVTCDSGLMHLAAARGARVVAMFGSTAPELGFAPAGEGHVVLCRHEPCQPCTLHGHERCPKGHFRCMRLLEPALVAEHALERLRPSPSSAGA